MCTVPFKPRVGVVSKLPSTVAGFSEFAQRRRFARQNIMCTRPNVDIMKRTLNRQVAYTWYQQNVFSRGLVKGKCSLKCRFSNKTQDCTSEKRVLRVIRYCLELINDPGRPGTTRVQVLGRRFNLLGSRAYLRWENQGSFRAGTARSLWSLVFHRAERNKTALRILHSCMYKPLFFLVHIIGTVWVIESVSRRSSKQSGFCFFHCSP